MHGGAEDAFEEQAKQECLVQTRSVAWAEMKNETDHKDCLFALNEENDILVRSKVYGW